MLQAFIAEGVDTMFGYPGGGIMPFYDRLYDYSGKLRHILVRHEQGAIHAAQGYARAKGVPGVVTVTSGPGATNVITGIADAMIDSTPLVVVTGQVGAALLGTDAFQETDVIGLTTPITKWNYQIRRAEDVAWAVARAFYIARSGRPGPVVLDITKDAQVGLADFDYKPCSFIRSYDPNPVAAQDDIEMAARMINEAEKPFVVFGQGIILSHAEEELKAFLSKTDIPAGSTLLGLSAIPSDFPGYIGMAGMHGNVAVNVMTQKCDLLLAVGMRFDDRVTGKTSEYARNAKIIHIDIDASEIGKLIKTDLGIVGDAKDVLSRLTELVEKKDRSEWRTVAKMCYAVENNKVINPELHPGGGHINMGEVVDTVADVTGGSAIIVTDVGQNQMIGARYSRFTRSRSMITSGGLGTMGFGIPAAIGAKIALPDRQVCLFVGDGGLQMTVEEFGTILQERVGVKIVLMNNNWLGNVRMWQQLFYNSRYSFTRMINPDFKALAEAYGIEYGEVRERAELKGAVEKMFADDKAWLLNVEVKEAGMVFPMVPPGKGVSDIMLNENDWFDYGD